MSKNTDYAYDLCSIALHVSGVMVCPSIFETYSDYTRSITDYDCVKMRAAERHAHALAGCLDAPIGDEV